METSATIAVGAPGGVRFLGTRTITVEGPGRTIIVRTGVTETLDHCHLTAEIAVDGKAFFNRSWDLDLRGSEWSVKGTVDSGHPERGPHR
jgi:hypothetical protein